MAMIRAKPGHLGYGAGNIELDPIRGRKGCTFCFIGFEYLFRKPEVTESGLRDQAKEAGTACFIRR
jgi:hypothetical protein